MAKEDFTVTGPETEAASADSPTISPGELLLSLPSVVTGPIEETSNSLLYQSRELHIPLPNVVTGLRPGD